MREDSGDALDLREGGAPRRKGDAPHAGVRSAQGSSIPDKEGPGVCAGAVDKHEPNLLHLQFIRWQGQGGGGMSGLWSLASGS